MVFYVLDENNNKVEAFDKEGVLAVLAQAIADGSLENIVADAAFVSKLKCCVSGVTHNMAFVTQAKYNELVEAGGLLENTYYWITDDSTCEDLNETLEALTNAVNDLSDFKDKATDAATKADEALTKATNAETTANECSKRAEARQYIDYNTLNGLIYDSGVSTQPRVDLSSLLLSGKTADDTIGIGGRLEVSLDGSWYIAVPFSTLWNSYHYNGGDLALHFYSGDKLYCLLIDLALDANNKIYATNIDCYNITDNKKQLVSKIKIYYLNIFYK